MRLSLYIIEARDADGRLDFTVPQPHHIFGSEAITGITEERMARVIYRRVPNAVLEGGSIKTWPRCIDPRFVARVKHW